MKSSFPNASQFSPTQTPLPELLLCVQENQPDRQKIKEAIRERFFAQRIDPDLADNTIYALSEYQLLDKPVDNPSYAAFTPLGEALAAKAKDGDYAAMYEELARHILLNLRGLDLVQCVDDVVARGTRPTKRVLSKELTYRGFHLPPNGTRNSKCRAWVSGKRLAGKTEGGGR